MIKSAGLFQGSEIKAKRAVKILLLFSVLFCSVFFVYGSVCADRALIPSAILHMDKQEVKSGAEAAGIIDRMHHGRVATGNDYIVRYEGNGNSSTLYVSVYENNDMAVSAMEDMARVMRKTDHDFNHFMKRMVRDRVVYMALGQGQAHYFFVRDKDLIWLAVDTEVAEQALEDVLLTEDIR